MNYSHGIVSNVTQSIRMAYENDIEDANIIPRFVKMRIERFSASLGHYMW